MWPKMALGVNIIANIGVNIMGLLPGWHHGILVSVMHRIDILGSFGIPTKATWLSGSINQVDLVSLAVHGQEVF